MIRITIFAMIGEQSNFVVITKKADIALFSLSILLTSLIFLISTYFYRIRILSAIHIPSYARKKSNISSVNKLKSERHFKASHAYQ